MKKLQQLFASVVLILVLSISVFAGDGIIEIGRTVPPPPPPSIATNNASEAEGIIEIGAKSTDSVTEVALSLLQGVLALF